MTYNLHPIFVHFPIALLTVYSIVRVLPLEYWFPKVPWKTARVVLLVCGVLGAAAALWTGDTAEHIARPAHAVVDMHSTFATLSTVLYSVLLVGELLTYLTAFLEHKEAVSHTLNSFLVKLERFLNHGVTARFLAFLALGAIFITGLLGGYMVYGESADPLVPYVLQILGLRN